MKETIAATVVFLVLIYLLFHMLYLFYVKLFGFFKPALYFELSEEILERSLRCCIIHDVTAPKACVRGAFNASVNVAMTCTQNAVYPRGSSKCLL